LGEINTKGGLSAIYLVVASTHFWQTLEGPQNKTGGATSTTFYVSEGFLKIFLQLSTSSAKGPKAIHKGMPGQPPSND
jgi:hypothetical protein